MAGAFFVILTEAGTGRTERATGFLFFTEGGILAEGTLIVIAAEGAALPAEGTAFFSREALFLMAERRFFVHGPAFGAEVVSAVSVFSVAIPVPGLRTAGAEGVLTRSFLVPGVAFKRTFFYAGFDQQPKHFDNPKILLLNVELELQGASIDSEVRVDDPMKFQEIVNSEWKMLQRKLEECRDCGANVVLSKKPIGDIATQFFADNGIFCAGRVPEDDIKRTAKATGGVILSTTSGIAQENLGTCAVFEEKQVGSKRFNLFTGCKGKAATIVLRGGAKQFLEEAERSIHDAIMIVRRAKKAGKVLGGAGAVEMLLSKALNEKAMKMDGKSQLIIQAYATALECIPRALANNAGFDSFEILNKMRTAES